MWALLRASLQTGFAAFLCWCAFARALPGWTRWFSLAFALWLLWIAVQEARGGIRDLRQRP